MQSVVLRATDLERRVFESVPTGIAPLDALTGGLPRGAITEIFGPPSSGRTSAMVSILAEATAQDEVCALVDGSDAFDPQSGMAAGLDLKRLLWVRCHKLDQVMKSTDLLLQGGGFGRVVMDLTDLPLSQLWGVSLASWFRFQRAIEKTPTTLVVISPESMVKSAAALVLHLEMKNAEWTTLLAERNVNIEIVRSRRSGMKLETRMTTPFALSKVASQHFLDAQPPLLGQEGNTFSSG
jgi:recombination protein RecA